MRAAEGYALERVNNARGDARASVTSTTSTARRRTSRASGSTSRRWARSLPKLGRKVIVDDKAKGVLPLLQLDGAAKEVKP